MTVIRIEQTATGWNVIQDKAKGLNKGLTTLGEFCGGNMGAALAKSCAKLAAEMTMADGVVLRLLGETETRWVQD